MLYMRGSAQVLRRNGRPTIRLSSLIFCLKKSQAEPPLNERQQNVFPAVIRKRILPLNARLCRRIQYSKKYLTDHQKTVKEALAIPSKTFLEATL